MTNEGGKTANGTGVTGCVLFLFAAGSFLLISDQLLHGRCFNQECQVNEVKTIVCQTDDVESV